MSSFLNPLRYENLDGSKLRLLEPFTYHVGSEFSYEKIEVPAGFECDAQSYPRLLWFIDPPQGQGAKAGFIHDYLYWLNGRRVPKTGIEYSRLRSDLIYLEALEVSGLPQWRATIRFLALRFFGWMAWATHGRRIKKELADLQQLQAKLAVAKELENRIPEMAHQWETAWPDESPQELETQILQKVEVLKNGEQAIPQKAEEPPPH